MKLPNQITLARLAVVVLGLTLLAIHPHSEPAGSLLTWVIFALLLVGAITDALDGYVARATGQVSKIGRMLDPLVDKILICGALIMLAAMPSLKNLIPAWVVTVIVAREFLVTGLRGMVEASGKSFGADALGKWKMVLQCVVVMALLAYQGGWLWVEPIAYVSIWVTLLVTVGSGANYAWKAWNALEF